MDDGLRKIEQRFDDHMVAIRARRDEISALIQRAIERATFLAEKDGGK